MEAMLSGSPLLFLDLRDRTLLGKVPDRATLLARAKEEYVKHCDAMLEQNVWPSVLMPAASPTFTRYADLVYGLARPAIIPTLHAVAGTLWRWRRDHLGA